MKGIVDLRLYEAYPRTSANKSSEEVYMKSNLLRATFIGIGSEVSIEYLFILEKKISRGHDLNSEKTFKENLKL